jgi:hypothetical protein
MITKPISFDSIQGGIFIILTVLLLSSCAMEKQARMIDTKMNDRQLFVSIKLGMSRTEVEELVGKPAGELSTNRIYYGHPPKIKVWQSPAVQADILVVYTSNNIVESKHFYIGNGILSESVPH